MKYYAGIDLGGTKIYSIIIDESGKILSREKLKTNVSEGFDSVIDRIVSCYKKAVESSGVPEKDIMSIGMAVPSAVNVDQGVLLFAPNLNWKNIELSRILYKKTGKPFFIDNDANMGIYGEYAFGAAKGCHNVYGIFIGTGIGGGYIDEGHLVRGLNYTAGEIGHLTVKIGGPKCNCGRRGCFEAIAGKVGIINYMKKLVDNRGYKTLLNEVEPGWKKSVGSSALKKCFEKKDRVVTKALIRAAKTIGIVAANLINTLGIDAIVLGGGIMEEMSEIFLPTIYQYMLNYSMAGGAKGVKLIVSTLGDDAVSFGAAWYASRPENKKYLFPN